MIHENIAVKVSNYETDTLNRTLIKYGNNGFKLVNVTMAKNKYGIEVMYLFFTKEVV